MSVYLLDTDHLSYLQERHERVVARLAALSETDRVFTSVVSMAELLRGVYMLPGGKRRRELLGLYRSLLGSMKEILQVSMSVAGEFAEIDAKLRSRGKPIPVNDVWVAATARAHGAVLVTNDAHFRQVERLQIENWTH